MYVLKFLFYLLYLIAAELPLFLILWIRNINGSYEILIVNATIISVLLNLLLFIMILIKVFSKSRNKQISNIVFDSENKIKQALSDYFAYFLLPFFTFNLIATSKISTMLMEMTVLFLLLTIFIMRTKNLSINIFIFMIFNIYEISMPGRKIVLLTPHTKADFESNDSPQLTRLFGEYYLYFENKKSIIKKISGVVLSCILILSFILMSEKILSFIN